MEKISKELKKTAAENPDQSFDVLIVLTNEKEAENIPIKDFKTYMGNILSVTVSGAEITKLSKLPGVQSIEIDGEVTAM